MKNINDNLTEITSISATTYYNLPPSIFTGGTVSGATNFSGGLSATTMSATTYYNLPTSTDIRVTGGTYSSGTILFTNNTGGTFNVVGLTTPFTGGTVAGATIFNQTTTVRDTLIYPPSTVQTTNATATLIKTISVSNNSVNMLEIDVCGGTTTGSAGIVYKIWTTYRKTSGGSLVLIGVDNIVSNSDYPYPIGGEVLVNSSGGNITVTVKGQAATVIDWGCSVKINTMVLGVL